jgi:hypothetical protein
VADAPTSTEAPTSTAPDPPVSIDRIPTWARRLIIALAIGGSFLMLAVWGTQAADPGASDLGDAVVALNPPEGAQVPVQTSVGADLALGYDGRLTITNGGQTLAIPEEQMEGARDPSTVGAEDLAENGVRPNNRNSVYFKPGPGKVFEEWTQGEVTIALRYFPERREEDAQALTWSIRVD